MHWIVAGIIFAIILFFVWADNQTKKQHAAFTKGDVIAALENVLNGDCHDEWDLFLAWPIQDTHLESIRQRCIAICEEYSNGEKGKDIAAGGEPKLLLILDELKSM